MASERLSSKNSSYAAGKKVKFRDAVLTCPCSAMDNALGRHVQWSMTYQGAGFKARSGCIRSPLKNYFT